eukprot:Gb_11637 [translate_table: standard]
MKKLKILRSRVHIPSDIWYVRVIGDPTPGVQKAGRVSRIASLFFVLHSSPSTMTDEPAVTRWKFQDFKAVYDAKFGRKRESGRPYAHCQGENGDKDLKDHRTDNCEDLRVAGNGNTKNSTGLAVYEQFLSRENNGTEFAGVAPERSRDKL